MTLAEWNKTEKVIWYYGTKAKKIFPQQSSKKIYIISIEYYGQ